MQNLSLEQQFQLRNFADQVQGIDRDQAEELLIEIYRQQLVQQSLFRAIMSREIPGFALPDAIG